MGVITDTLRLILMRSKLKRRKKKKKKIVKIYSEDSNRIDRDGGPYFARINNEDNKK